MGCCSFVRFDKARTTADFLQGDPEYGSFIISIEMTDYSNETSKFRKCKRDRQMILDFMHSTIVPDKDIQQNEISIRFIFTIPFSKKNHSLFLKPFNMEYYYTRLCIKQSFELLNIRQAYLQSMKTRWKNEIFYTLVGGFGDRRLRSEGTDRGFWIRLSLVFIYMIVGGSQIIMFLKSIIFEVD